MTEVYNITLRSNKKIGGTNSDAQFLIKWDTILPKGVDKFNLKISFLSQEITFDYLNDEQNIETRINLGSNHYNYDNTNNCSNSLLHYSGLDAPISAECDVVYKSLFDKTYMVDRPVGDIITVKNYILNNLLSGDSLNDSVFTTTNVVDPSYIIELSFIPIYK